MKSVTAWIMAFCLLMVLLPSSISAHAYIVKSDPYANEVLKKSPSKVTIQFNETIQPVFHSLQVTDEHGNRVDRNDVSIDEHIKSMIEAHLQPNLPNGLYTISWKVISGDGHPVQGTIPFQIGTAQGRGAGTAVTQPADHFPKLSLVIIRWVQYIGLAFVLGIHCFHLYIYPGRGSKGEHGVTALPRSRLILWISYTATAVGILLSLPVQTSVDAGVPWSQAWNASLLKSTLVETSFGGAWYAELIFILFLGTSIYLAAQSDASISSRRLWGNIAIGFGLGVLLAKSFIGHAAAEKSRFMAISANFVHLSAVSIWIGCLLAIAILLPPAAQSTADQEERKRQYWISIQRFSYLGTALAAIILLTGIYSSLQYVPTVYAMYTTVYGQVLLAKMALFLIMLCFAAYNLIQGKRRKRKLGISVWVEFGSGIAALLLAAVLTNLPSASSAPGPFHQTHTVKGGQAISLDVTPNIVGPNMFRVQVKDENGKLIQDIEQIKLVLTSKEMNMGEYTINIPNNHSGTFQTEDMITMAELWNIHVHVLMKSLDTLDTDFTVPVGSE
ncbi:copper resistance protein CopC [Paenibacillus sediminis]|uniref:Copper transport protein n=1 Tax=Paenibacillus sediminis TaxID=664909 RepID=A0ABS4H3B5_9BACL|nr:copper resistance protein CopC [Paenibacillus sediminis]MBP1936971.1 copper transport protein [Paenibacillus sediminis]